MVKLYENYESIELDTRIKMNETINTIFDRNKEVLNRYTNETLIAQFV